MTEYTPTEPEIAAALAHLRVSMEHLSQTPRPRLTQRDIADVVTRAAVEAALDILDYEIPDAAAEVRKARAAIEARRRWAEQETKAA